MDRTCHVVDVENLIGRPEGGQVHSPDVFSELSREVAALYHTRWVRPGDLVYVGCDASIVLETALAWSRSSVRVGRGPNGADRALLDVIDLNAVVRSCRVLQIASGDGAFADLARRARSRGLYVRVVAKAGHLSRTLRANSDGAYLMN